MSIYIRCRCLKWSDTEGCCKARAIVKGDAPIEGYLNREKIWRKFQSLLKDDDPAKDKNMSSQPQQEKQIPRQKMKNREPTPKENSDYDYRPPPLLPPPKRLLREGVYESRQDPVDATKSTEPSNAPFIETQLKLVLLQVQCLQALDRRVPTHLMDELEILYSVMFEEENSRG